MTEELKRVDTAAIPRAELVRQIRNDFGITQAQLAEAMGTSLKAIQSYEQGWRNVPTRVLVQLFVLLAIHRSREVDHVPCWEVTQCPSEERASCPCYTLGQGQFCWFVSGRSRLCGGQKQRQERKDDELMPCMGCNVIRRLLPANLVNGCREETTGDDAAIDKKKMTKGH